MKNPKNHYLIKLITTIILMSLMTSTLIFANEITINGNDDSESIDMVYFYMNLCEYCVEAKELIDSFISDIESEHLDVTINFHTYNISYYDGIEYETFKSYLDYHELEEVTISTPIIFIGDTYFEGEEEIREGLQELMSEIKAGERPSTPLLDPTKDSSSNLIDTFNNLNFLKIFGIGIINGLNPCSFSMLLLLLSLLLVKDAPLKKLGLSFILGKFATFILLGTVLYQLLSYLQNSSFMFFSKLVIGIFVILLATLNIYDYYVSKREDYGKIKNQLPKGLRRLNHIIIETLVNKSHTKWLSISLFVLGAIIAMGEFLCTGQIYMVTITYMIKTGSTMSLQAFIYLVIYSLGFIIPPTIVILVTSKTNELFNVSEFIREKMPMIKLITAFILIILGIVTIFL